MPVPPPPPPPPPPEGGFTVRDGSVGYIDPASPADQVRLRAILATTSVLPNRAEFFYAKGQPFGPGVPRPEQAIDFQDQTLYLEKTFAPNWSIFAEGGVVSLNPDINNNTTGLGDSNLGFKYAFLSDECEVWTFQLLAYLPTGAASRGLGTHHVSLEPAVLGFVRLTDNLGLASEVRYWQPIDGTDFAGGILRYGLGLRYDLWEGGGWRLAPTAEAIGWTVLGGHESRLLPDGSSAVLDSTGTTVVNVKLGPASIWASTPGCMRATVWRSPASGGIGMSCESSSVGCIERTAANSPSAAPAPCGNSRRIPGRSVPARAAPCPRRHGRGDFRDQQVRQDLAVHVGAASAHRHR